MGAGNIVMDIFAKIAENRIKEATENGIFEDLQNKGRPLIFEDETWIPEDLRLAYRFLKNSGYIPQELELRNDIINLKAIINALDDDKERLKKIRELNYKLLKLNTLRGKPINLDAFPEYKQKIIDKWIR